MTQPTYEQVLAVCSRFAFGGDVTDLKVCGNGHINSTFVDDDCRYILQKIKKLMVDLNFKKLQIIGIFY